MYDLLKLIKPKFTSVEYDTLFTLLQTRTLTAASKATDAFKKLDENSAYKKLINSFLGNVETVT